MPDNWLDGVDTEEASSLLDNIGALRSKNPGSIIIPVDTCGNGVCDLGENCFSCPIDCDIKPDVVESLCDTSIGFYTLSPNPYIDSENACINSNIYARFTTKVDVDLLDSNIQLTKCSSRGVSCNTIIPSEISSYNEGIGFVLNPDTNLEGGAWYKVSINSISTICGKTSDPYDWYFKVLPQNCSPTDLELNINEHIFPDLNLTTEIMASSYDNQCRNLESNANFNWSREQYNSSGNLLYDYNYEPPLNRDFSYIAIKDGITLEAKNNVKSFRTSGSNYSELTVENSGASDSAKFWTRRIYTTLPTLESEYCGDAKLKAGEDCDDGHDNGIYDGASGVKCSYDCKNVYVYNNNAFNFRFYYPKSKFNYDLISLPDKVNDLNKAGDIRIITSSGSTEDSARVFMDENSNPAMVLRVWTVPKENYIPITFQEWLSRKGIGGDYDFVKRSGVVSDYLIYNQGNSYYFWVPNYVEMGTAGNWYVNVYVLSYKEGGDLAFFNQIIDTIEFNINIASEITCNTLYRLGEESGIYTLRLKDGSNIRAYCFMSNIAGKEGGWTVVAAENLERSDSEYALINRFPKPVSYFISQSGAASDIDNYIPKIIPSDEAYSYLDIWPNYTEYTTMSVYSKDFEDGTTGNRQDPIIIDGESVYYEFYTKYGTNDFGEVNCNMIDLVLNSCSSDTYGRNCTTNLEDLPSGCSFSMVDNFENYFPHDLIYSYGGYDSNSFAYNDTVHTGFTWFSENRIQFYFWGQWTLMGSVAKSDIFVVRPWKDGWIDTYSCDAGWVNNDCRMSKKSYTERSALNQKLLLMVK